MKCPFCGSQAYRRWGVHFDHEFMCSNSECKEVFDPEDIEDIEQRKGVIGMAQVNAKQGIIKNDNTAVGCGTCLYWVHLGGGEVDGECRKNPPVPLLVPENGSIPDGYYPVLAEDEDNMLFLEGHWPLTCFSEWCGQYEQDPAKAKDFGLAASVVEAQNTFAKGSAAPCPLALAQKLL